MFENERRQNTRFQMPLRLHVRITWVSNRGKRLQISEETTSENISSKGCFFYLSKKPTVGARVAIEITVPWFCGLYYGAIACKGSVVRVEDRASKGAGKSAGKTGVACKIESYAFKTSSNASNAGAGVGARVGLAEVFGMAGKNS